ncbi:MAG: hypothetical protein AB1782_03995 [Cyanobacteriota bacterium]
MEIRNISPALQAKKSISFMASNKENKQVQYIDKTAAYKAASGAFLGNILGGWLIGIPVVKSILESEISKNALKVASKTKLVGASLAMLACSAIPAFLAAKFMVNRNRSEEQKISNANLAKLTAASMVGTAAFGTLGNLLQAKMGPGIMPMLANAFITIFGNDATVSTYSKHHNKKATPPPQDLHYIMHSSGPGQSNEFHYFMMKTQGSNQN